MITIIVSQNELVHNVESLVKLNSHIPSRRFTRLNVCCSLVTFGNTHKVDTKATMNEKKWKINIDHGVQCLHFQKKKKKKIKIISNWGGVKLHYMLINEAVSNRNLEIIVQIDWVCSLIWWPSWLSRHFSSCHSQKEMVRVLFYFSLILLSPPGSHFLCEHAYCLI